MSDDEANAIAEILGSPQLTVRWRAGVALIPRGEFSVVVAALAVGAGAEALGPLTACYVLLTIVLGAAVIRLPDRLRPERNVAS
jgi:monovalent cation:H+ antiporter-2, CPA2 family